MTGAAVRGVAVCELDGCDKPVDQLPGSAQLRRYCCAAHRKMARTVRPDDTGAGRTEPDVQRNAAGDDPGDDAPEEQPDSASSGTVNSTGPDSTEAGTEATGQAESAAPDQQDGASYRPSEDPPTEPIPIMSAHRNVVPEPKSRWFRRTRRPYAARGVRARSYLEPDPLPSQPDWLQPPVPDRVTKRAPRQVQPDTPPQRPWAPSESYYPPPGYGSPGYPPAGYGPPAYRPYGYRQAPSPTRAPGSSPDAAGPPTGSFALVGDPAIEVPAVPPHDPEPTRDTEPAGPDDDTRPDADAAAETPGTPSAVREPDRTGGSTRSAGPVGSAPSNGAAEQPLPEGTAAPDNVAESPDTARPDHLAGSRGGAEPAEAIADAPAEAAATLVPTASTGTDESAPDAGATRAPSSATPESATPDAATPDAAVAATATAAGPVPADPAPVGQPAGARSTPDTVTRAAAPRREPVISPAAPVAPAGSAEPHLPSTPTTTAEPTTPVAPAGSAQPHRPVKTAAPSDPVVAGIRGRLAARRIAAAQRRAKKRDTPINPNPAIQSAWLAEAREALSAALHSLSANRLRAVLTTIGIIAGVASVILMVAMGDGMSKGFNDQFSRFATQLTISPVTGPVVTGKAPMHLTDEDYKALHDTERAPDIDLLSAAVASNSVTLTAGQQKAGAKLYGIEQNYLVLDNRHMVAGTWFTQKQIDEGSHQVVLGPQAVNLLWGVGTDPRTVIGQPLRVGHSTFQIQGVVNSDGQDDNVAMVPLAAARAYVVGNNGGKLDVIIAKSSSIATLQQAEAEIYEILDDQHHVRRQTDRDFNVTDNTSILQQQMSTIRFLQMFIIAIAAISLFVGGVGVANIMLVSVTERTREIGIRKAIGAPRRAIMRQFLSEAVMVTALGGAIGVVLGIGLCLLGKVVIPELWPPDPNSLTPTPLPLLSICPVLIAFGVSLAIGLLAGCYPAFRASRLRPIEALRFE